MPTSIRVAMRLKLFDVVEVAVEIGVGVEIEVEVE